ncbi:MAG TPA: glycosyl hydrolase-related protein, partial [Fimbriimonadaceae bacterium]|nr:glycosyl hydrolase-related protein [Fimbriimonadaceae bacterium]
GPFIQPILLASRRSCHGEGNWYTQPGDHHFHFSLTSGRDSLSGSRDAADAQLGLMAVVAPRSARGQALPETLSFAGTSMPGVRISTIKKAEDNNAVIVRCYETEGRDVAGRIRLFEPVRAAKLCDIIEDEKRSIDLASIRVGHFAIETYKLLMRGPNTSERRTGRLHPNRSKSSRRA